jgi:hypothetical protein
VTPGSQVDSGTIIALVHSMNPRRVFGSSYPSADDLKLATRRCTYAIDFILDIGDLGDILA